jgi:hypothetical protein
MSRVLASSALLGCFLAVLAARTARAATIYFDGFDDGQVAANVQAIGGAALSESGGQLRVTVSAPGQGVALGVPSDAIRCFEFSLGVIAPQSPVQTGDRLTWTWIATDIDSGAEYPLLESIWEQTNSTRFSTMKRDKDGNVVLRHQEISTADLTRVAPGAGEAVKVKWDRRTVNGVEQVQAEIVRVNLQSGRVLEVIKVFPWQDPPGFRSTRFEVRASFPLVIALDAVSGDDGHVPVAAPAFGTVGAVVLVLLAFVAGALLLRRRAARSSGGIFRLGARVPALLVGGLIATSSIPASAQPDKQTLLNVVVVNGADVADVGAEVAEADRIYRKEATNKKILIRDFKIVADPGGLLDLDEYAAVGTPTAEETQLLAICRVVENCVVNVFFVRSLSNGSLGESFWDAGWGGMEEGSVVVATSPMEPNSRTLAHEIGHVLTDDGGHSADAGNVMRGTPPVGDDFDTAGSPGQSAAIRGSRYCCPCRAVPAASFWAVLALAAAVVGMGILALRRRRRRTAWFSGAALVALLATGVGWRLLEDLRSLECVHAQASEPQGLDLLMYGVEWKEGRQALAAQGAKALAVADRFLDDPEQYLVRRAVILVGDLAEKRVDTTGFTPRLYEILRTRDPVLQADVIRSFARAGNAAHLTRVRPLAAHEDYLVRSRVAEALGKLGSGKEDRDLLLQLARDARSSAVRREAEKALAAFEGR